jgi:ribosomal protein S18 acetylase RimI-like enzyme
MVPDDRLWPARPYRGRVFILECRAVDVPVLEAAMPTGGSRFHERRFARHESGASTFLIGWLAEQPVGLVEIRWDGCAADEVRQLFPGVPELNGLEVWPPWRRSRGLGAELITEVERRVAAAGHPRLGLGVGDDNPRAAGLYLRLGYAETGCRYLDRYEITDGAGARRLMADPCRFLIKDLRPAG